ncbi:MAG: ABC transporter permease, partial [Maritimibacter sp.]|nr:ABC transporter permease [Maritimibacter sp.]
MTRAGLAALWSHWRRHPLQLFTLLAGLALATGLWSSVQAVNAEARASYDAAAATLGEGRYDALVPRVGDTIPLDRFVALRRAGWLVSPVLEGRLAVGESAVRLVGLDVLTAPRGLGQLSDGDGVSLADILLGRVLYAAPDVATLLDGAVAVRVLSDPGIAPGTVVGDISGVQRLLDRPDAISRLILLPDQPLGRPPLESVAPDLARQAAAGGSEIGRLTDSFHLNLTAFGLLSFAVGIFIVHGAIGLAFEQRRGMVRTMRAVGMPLRRIVGLFALELSAFALAGGFIGIVLGYVVAATLLPGVAATLDGLYGAQVAGTLQLRPVWWLSGLAMAFAGTALAATDALRRIARMPVLAGGGARAWAMAAGRGRRLQGIAALALLGAAGVLAFVGGGLVAGFALLACLLFGAALALPVLLDLVLAGLQRWARAVTWDWFWADTRQQLPGLSLALMALLLAMAANVGVSTMVSSFRLT